MLNRQLTEWGVEPLLGYVVGLFAFFILSIQLFEKTSFAIYIYGVLTLSTILKLNEPNRNSFLKLCFSRMEYLKLRIIENSIVALPFTLFLLYQEDYLFAFSLTIAGVLLSQMDLRSNLNFTLPTPFGRRPFEFTVGFRSNYLIYFFAYFLTIMAISVGNFELGIFSLIVALLACLNYFTHTENDYYVWIFSLSPKEFIRYKWKTIVLYTGFLCLPILLSLSFVFYSKMDIILGFQCLGYLFIFTTMLAKYSVFPDSLNIRFSLVLVFTIWLPPLLLLIIPYLYLQSIKKLNQLLP